MRLMEITSLKIMMYDESRRVYTMVCLVCGASAEADETEDDEDYIEIDLQHLMTCALAMARVKMIKN